MKKATYISWVKALAWIYIVLGILGVLASLALILFGSAMAGMFAKIAGFELLAGLGVVVLSALGFFLLIWNVINIVAGMSLLKFKNWARWFVLIVSILGILSVPVGTTIGALAIWILLVDNNAKRSFK